MKNKRKICAALMLISFMSHCATAADDEIFTGSCYDSANYPTEGCVWTLNKTNGTLIFGNSEGVGVGPPSGIDDVLKAAIEEGVISDGIETVVNTPFASMPNLKKVFLPDTLKSVSSLIYNCSQIEELSFDNRYSIGGPCTCCPGLKTVYLGPSVSRTPFYNTLSLFNQCRANGYGHNIISINVDEENPTLKSVKGALLTKDGKKLIDFPFGRTSKAVIPHGVEETESNTFRGCPLTSVTIPDTFKTTSDVFSGCNNLSTINFFGIQEPTCPACYTFCGSEVINVPHDYNGDTLWGYPVRKVIDHHGYLSDGCTYWMTQKNDTQITIGGEGELTSDLLSAGNQGWFAHNATLEEIDIEEGITAVDMNMFSGCDKLKKVTFPLTLQKLVIADGTIDGAVTVDTGLMVDSFSACVGLTEIVLPEGTKTLIFAPGAMVMPGVTSIEFSMFSNLDSVDEVTISSNVDWVHLDSFPGVCEEREITVNYLGDTGPLYSACSPANITVNVRKDYPEDSWCGFPVNKVFDCGTYNDIKWLNGPHNTLEITGSGAIDANCPWKDFKSSVKKLVIGDGITSIAPGTFYGYNFDTVELPDTLETIGWSAFDSCRQLTNVVLPSGVKSIGKKAFQGCENLESITLNEGLEEIGRNAFDGCKNLHSITLPKSVKKIEDAALRNRALTEIRVADGNDFYYDVDGVLFSKPDLALVQYPTGQGGLYVVPENVTKINDSAFACAENLESVTIKGPLKSIGKDAFYGCYNLKSVHIDGEVESIDNSAFAFCKSLRVLEYNGEPKLGEDVFFGCGVPNQTPAWKLSNIIDGPIASAIYANGLWVARPEISKTGELYHSKDGRSWSTIPVAAERLNFVTHENGLWVAGGLDGMYYSTDGETWTKTNISGDCSFATNANGMWVAGGYGGDEYEGLYYSVDGKSWTSARFPGSSCNTAKYANGVWVLSGLSSDTGLYYSTDGMNWTQSNVTAGGFQTITYTDGLWHAGGYNSGTGLYYSTDGKTWTLSNLPSGESSFNDYGTYSVITKANDVWVTGEFGQNNYCTGLYYSTDGKTWTQSNVVSGSFEFIVNANGLWVAGSNGNTIYNRGLYYSTDGKTWTQSNVTNESIVFVENANGMWVVGSRGTGDYGSSCGLYYSMDGKTWIKSNVSDQGTTFATNANGLWVASGYDGLYYSTVLYTFT